MDHFYLLEVVASEVFSSKAMARHERTAQYLSALATLAQALARQEQTLAEIEAVDRLLAATPQGERHDALALQRQRGERDRELAQLALRGIDLWINTLSGSFAGKEQLAQALQALAAEVDGGALGHTFPSDAEMDRMIAGL